VNAGNYTATLSETSTNYTLGTPSSFSWSISQATGFISLYQIPAIHPNNSLNTVVYNDHLDWANITSGVNYVFTQNAPYGLGAGDAIVQSGYGVQSRTNTTAGFSIDITVTITDPNYTASSATTTITFLGYTPSSSGGGTTTYY
jgi:hypothetical protein